MYNVFKELTVSCYEHVNMTLGIAEM